MSWKIVERLFGSGQVLENGVKLCGVQYNLTIRQKMIDVRTFGGGTEIPV